MTPDLSRIAESPNLYGISVTDRRAGGDTGKQGSDTEQITGVTSLSWQCLFPRDLHPELLVAIFLAYAQDCPYWSDSPIVPSWIAVSYVCRYWRNVALHCASLWATHLFFVSSEWMDELLRRSKNVPLIVRVDLCYYFTPRVGQICSLEKALGNMERIQDLWIDFPSDMIDILRPRLNAATPLLRSLRLSGWNSPEDHYFAINKDTLPGAIPGLRMVHLQSCRVDWSSLMFNGLTELTLRYLENGLAECWHGVLQILMQLPYLRQLCLDRLVPSNIGAIFPNSSEQGERISLLHLTELALTGPIYWAIALLAHLELPKSLTFCLECHCGDPQGIPRLLALIPDQVGNHLPMTGSAQTALRYLDLNRDVEGWKFTYGSSTTDAYRANMFLSRPSRQDFLLIRAILGSNWEVIFSLFCAFPVAQLNAITVCDAEHEFENEDLWTEVFQNASGLHTVGVQSSHFHALVRALHPRDDAIPVPTLTDLRLGQIKFDRRDCSCERDHSGEGGIQCLLHALAKRAEVGNILPRLDLIGCSNITEGDVMELSRVVGQVDVDYSRTELGVEFEDTN